jgi:hypothetical protein
MFIMMNDRLQKIFRPHLKIKMNSSKKFCCWIFLNQLPSHTLKYVPVLLWIRQSQLHFVSCSASNETLQAKFRELRQQQNLVPRKKIPRRTLFAGYYNANSKWLINGHELRAQNTICLR